MNKILTYTLTSAGIEPSTPQFAGVQGGHRATALVIKPDSSVSSFIEKRKAQSEEVSFRIDVTNQAGQTFPMNDAPIEELSNPFYLTQNMTISGLDCVAVLYITAKDQDGQTEVYKAQMRLYFEQSRGGVDTPEEISPVVQVEEKYLECEQKLNDHTQKALSSIEQKIEVVRQASSDIAQRHAQAADLANQAELYAGDAKASAQAAEQESASSSAMLAEVRRIAHAASDLTARSESAAARADKGSRETAENLAQVSDLAGKTAENATKASSAAERAEASSQVFSTKQDLFAEVEVEFNQRIIKPDRNLSFVVGPPLQNGTLEIGSGYVSAFCFGDMEFSSEIGGIMLRGKAEEDDVANVDVCGCRIRNLAEPKNPADAVNKAYFDSVLGDIDTAIGKVISVEESYIGGARV